MLNHAHDVCRIDFPLGNRKWRVKMKVFHMLFSSAGWGCSIGMILTFYFWMCWVECVGQNSAKYRTSHQTHFSHFEELLFLSQPQSRRSRTITFFQFPDFSDIRFFSHQYLDLSTKTALHIFIKKYKRFNFENENIRFSPYCTDHVSRIRRRREETKTRNGLSQNTTF